MCTVALKYCKSQHVEESKCSQQSKASSSAAEHCTVHKQQWKRTAAQRTEDWCGAEQGAPAAQFLHLLLLVGALTTWRQAGGGEQELTGQATYLTARCVMQ